MGLFDSLGSIGSLLDPGKMAHQLVDSFLPKDMQWVGGLVGTAVDYECGNIPGAISEGMGTLSDLKDLAQSKSAQGQGATASTDAAGKPSLAPDLATTFQYEPSPPPTTSNTTTTTSSSSSSAGKSGGASQGAADLIDKAASMVQGAIDAAKAAGASTTQKATLGPDARFNPLTPHASASQSSKTSTSQGTQPDTSTKTTTTVTTTTVTQASSGPAQEARTGAGHFGAAAAPDGAQPAVPPPATSASSAPASSASTAAPAATTTSTPTTSATTASTAGAPSADSSSAAGSTASVKQLLAMSNDDLQKAIASGNVPQNLSNSDMLSLQQRMNQISQMSQTMTQLITAMHDMQMAVARNIHA